MREKQKKTTGLVAVPEESSSSEDKTEKKLRPVVSDNVIWLIEETDSNHSCAEADRESDDYEEDLDVDWDDYWVGFFSDGLASV